MPGFTPTLLIPYPVDGDSLKSAVQSTPQALAERVDAMISSMVAPNAPWTPYVPTAVGGNAGAGAVFAGRKTRVLNTVHWWASVVLGTTGRNITAGFGLTLPYTAEATQIQQVRGVMTDTGTGTWSAVMLQGTTSVSFWIPGTNGQYVALSAAAPFTWTNGDVLQAAGTYEAA